MVTTRSQDRNVEESDLPLRSRASDAPSELALKRSRSTTDDSHTAKRARVSHDASPGVRAGQLDRVSNEIHEAAPVTIDLPEQRTDSALETSPFNFESIDAIQHDNDPPLKLKTNIPVISGDSAERTDTLPQWVTASPEGKEKPMPAAEGALPNTKYGSDSESETYITAASVPGSDNLRDLPAPASNAGPDEAPDRPPLGMRAESIQDYPAIQIQRQGQSETNSKSHNVKERDFVILTAPGRLTQSQKPESRSAYAAPKPAQQSSFPAQLQAASSSPSRLHARPPSGASRDYPKTLRLQHPARSIPQLQPSSSLSRYKQTAFERHKRTPHWAGKKSRFVGVGIGVGMGVGAR